MKLIQIAVPTLLLSIKAVACLQVTGTTIHGERTESGGISPARHLRWSLTRTPEEHLDDIVKALDMQKEDAVTRSEIAGVRAVCLGQSEEAIRIFKEIETEHPGRYSTAANLGTAYELHGDLELAMKWIGEGIQRNPDSHGGTEWLHLEILKTRMKLREDPGYLDGRNVIGLPETLSPTSKIRVNEHDYSVEQIDDALLYQLEERMHFVKPTDPVVADLLFTYGKLIAHTRMVESGIGVLELARTYGFRNSSLLEQTISRFKWIVRFRIAWQTALILLAILGFIAWLRYASRRRWFFVTRKQQLAYEQAAIRHKRRRSSEM